MAVSKERKARSGSPSVYNLIKAMNSDEKRFFKLYVQRYDKEGGNIYQALFDIINGDLQKRGDTDDERIKPLLKGLSIEAYFSSAKNKLKEMIGIALFEMQSKQNEAYELYRDMAIADILHNKGLTEDAEKMLSKAMRTAQKKEYHTLWLEGSIHRYNHSARWHETPAPVLRQWQHEALQQRLQLSDLMDKIYLNRLSFVNYIAAPDTMDAASQKMMQEKELLHQLDTAQSTYARYLALNALVFYYDKKRDMAQLKDYTKQQRDVLEQTLVHTRRFRGEYFVAYQNYLSSLDPLHERLEIIKGSQAYEEAAEKYLHASDTEGWANTIVSACMLRLNTYIENSSNSGLQQEVAVSLSRYRKFEHLLAPIKKVVFQTLIKDALFALERYQDCLRWVKLIKTGLPAGTLHNRRICNFFSELIALIETDSSIKSLKNSEENLRSAIVSATQDKEMERELLLMVKTLKNYSSARNREERKKELRFLKGRVVLLRRAHNKQLSNIISESGVVQWLRSKGETV
ncbi:MAG: hypothetical protein U0T75_16200 [Chitinophagales bacterium]